jgi:hypothetical protein
MKAKVTKRKVGVEKSQSSESKKKKVAPGTVKPKKKAVKARRLTAEEVRRLTPKKDAKSERKSKSPIKKVESPLVKSFGDTNPESLNLEQIIIIAMDSLAESLGLPKLKISNVEYSDRQVTLSLANGKQATGYLSAPRSFLVNCWAEQPKLKEQLFSLQSDGYTLGDWDLVRRTLTCDFDEDEAAQVHTDWLALINGLLKFGEKEEAQLVWLQCSDFGLVNPRSSFFKGLFQTVPQSAKLTSASSCAAFLERMLPYTSSPAVIDRFVAARALLDNLAEALSEISGKRRTSLVDNFVVALNRLSDDPSPAVRELAVLLRRLWDILGQT